MGWLVPLNRRRAGTPLSCCDLGMGAHEPSELDVCLRVSGMLLLMLYPRVRIIFFRLNNECTPGCVCASTRGAFKAPSWETRAPTRDAN